MITPRCADPFVTVEEGCKRHVSNKQLLSAGSHEAGYRVTGHPVMGLVQIQARGFIVQFSLIVLNFPFF